MKMGERTAREFITMFCEIDDFGKTFALIYERYLIALAGKQRRRPMTLALSDIITLIIAPQPRPRCQRV